MTLISKTHRHYQYLLMLLLFRNLMNISVFHNQSDKKKRWNFCSKTWLENWCVQKKKRTCPWSMLCRQNKKKRQSILESILDKKKSKVPQTNCSITHTPPPINSKWKSFFPLLQQTNISSSQRKKTSVHCIKLYPRHYATFLYIARQHFPELLISTEWKFDTDDMLYALPFERI